MRKFLAFAILLGFVAPATAYPYGRQKPNSTWEMRKQAYERMKTKQAMRASEANANAADASAKAAGAHARQVKDQMRDMFDTMSQNSKSAGLRK